MLVAASCSLSSNRTPLQAAVQQEALKQVLQLLLPGVFLQQTPRFPQRRCLPQPRTAATPPVSRVPATTRTQQRSSGWPCEPTCVAVRRRQSRQNKVLVVPQNTRGTSPGTHAPGAQSLLVADKLHPAGESGSERDPQAVGPQRRRPVVGSRRRRHTGPPRPQRPPAHRGREMAVCGLDAEAADAALCGCHAPGAHGRCAGAGGAPGVEPVAEVGFPPSRPAERADLFDLSARAVPAR